MRYPAKKDLWAVCLIALAFIGFGIFFMAMGPNLAECPCQDSDSVVRRAMSQAQPACFS